MSAEKLRFEKLASFSHKKLLFRNRWTTCDGVRRGGARIPFQRAFPESEIKGMSDGWEEAEGKDRKREREKHF